MHALRRSATVVAFLTCALSSQALTTYTWTGTAGGNSLDTAGNWSSAPTFDATAELMFLNLPATGTTLTLDGSKTIGKLSVSYAASPQDYAMTIAAGTPTSGALTVGDLAVALSTANGQRGNVNLNVPVTVPVAGGTWTISGQVSGGGSTQRCNLNSTLTALGPLNIFGTGNAQGAFFVNGAATLASLTRGTKSAVTFNGTTTISGNLTLNGDPGSCFTTFAADDTMIGGNVVFTSNSSSLSFNGSRTTVTGTLNGLQSGCTINFYGGNNTFGGAVTENCNNGILYFHGGTNTFAVSPITYSLGNLGAGGEGAWGTASIAYTLGVPLLFSGHHTVTNLIACTGTGTALIMKPNSGVVTFAGPLTGFAAAKGFTVSGADGVLVFNPTSGLNGNAITVTGGALSSASTGLAGNILINGLVGVLLLDNLSWNAWNAARPYGVAAGQWQHTAGGFAARGTAPLLIDSLPGAFTLDRNLTLGISTRTAAGAYYANQPVYVSLPAALTARRTFSIAPTGAGLTGSDAASVVPAFTNAISGAGVPVIGTARAATRDDEVAELAFANGGKSWTGSAFFTVASPLGFNTGSGGLLVNNAFLRFDSPAALPSGATATAYLAALSLSSPMQRQGFIFGGASGAGHTYDFTGSNYKIVIGCNAGTDAQVGTLGATAGKSTLQGVEVCWHQFGSPRASATLLVRSGSEFVLGGVGKPVTFRTTENSGPNVNEADSGLAGAATAIVTDAGLRNIQKRGSGTLVLANAVWAPASVGGMVSVWQLGRGAVGNTGASTYFDGAVRETGIGPTNSFNPVISPRFQGGVLEITSDWANRTMNDWSNGGGGFAAFGGDFSIGLGASKTWASNFVPAGEPLIFGSETANGRITFTSAINLGASGTNTREIRVLDNLNASGDYARLSGIVSAGGGTQGLLKSGAGLLQLTVANSYNGGTTVRAGTLCANNATGSGTGSGNVTVESGAKLGGSGAIAGAVTVAANGTLDAGEQAGAVGTLTVNAAVTLAENARATCDYSAATGDKVVVNGTLTLPAAATVTTVGTATPTLPITIFTATTLATQPGGVAGWTLAGPLAGEELKIVGNTVVIRAKPRGTTFLLR